jgi:hypothetical protein
MKTYKVDLDYEASLFDPHYNPDLPKYQKIIREFEYVFFLVEKEKSILKNSKDYEKKYLDHLRSLHFTIPDLNSKTTEFEFWWGKHHNLHIEQFLNSKLTSAQLAKERGWGFAEGAIVSNFSELKNHLAAFPERKKWIIKKPHSFSGIGHFKFGKDELSESVISKVLTEPSLLEPEYERLFDIGTTFIIENGQIKNHFMVENFNSENGGFKGGAGSSNVDKFKKYILGKYHFDLSALENVTKKIAAEYVSMGAVSNVQIDSFIYKESDELKLYPLVEVNYRKTMGLVIQSLAEKNPDVSFVEWRIEPSKNIDSYSDWTKLSPEGNHFHSYFKSFQN